MTRTLALPLILTLGISTLAVAQGQQALPPATCPTVTEAEVRSVFDNAQAAISKEFVPLEKQYLARLEELNRKVADSGKGYPLKSWWGRTGFSLDLPVSTLKNREIVLKVPEFKNKDQRVSWHGPGTCPVTKVKLDVPQVKCETKWLKWGPLKTRMVKSCKTWVGPTSATIQSPCVKRYDAILSVPTVSMKDRRIVIGVPEFRSETRKFSLDLPQITQVDMAERGKKASSEIAAMVNSFDQDVAKLQAKHIGPAFDTLTSRYDLSFSCLRNKGNDSRAKLVKEQEADMARFDATFAAIHDKTHARGDANALLQDLLKRRASVVTAQERALAQLDNEYKTIAKHESAARETLRRAVKAIFPKAREVSEEEARK